MPTIPRRALLIGAVAIAVIGSIVAVLPDRSEPRSEVGMEDTAPSRTDEAPTRSTATTIEDLAAGDSPANASPGEVATTGATVAGPRTAPGGTTSTTAATPDTNTPTTSASPSAPARLTNLRGRIVYQHNQPTMGSLWSMLPDGTDARPLDLPGPNGHQLTGTLDVSPDGSLVARKVGGSTPDGLAMAARYDVVLQDIATGTARNVLEVFMFDYTSLRFSPDGRTLAVSGSTQWPHQVKLIDVRTGTLRTLTTDLSAIQRVTWAPDGRSLLTSDLHEIDVRTGATTNRSSWLSGSSWDFEDYGVNASWSPNGDVFVTASGTTPGVVEQWLCRIDPETGAVSRLQNTGNVSYYNDYLPDGRILRATTAGLLEVLDRDGVALASLPFPWGAMSYVTPRG